MSEEAKPSTWPGGVDLTGDIWRHAINFASGEQYYRPDNESKWELVATFDPFPESETPASDDEPRLLGRWDLP